MSKGLYRNIHVSMWGDAKFRALSDDGKMLWIYLLTGPETTSAPGCMAVGRASLTEGLDWELERFNDAFGELETAGMAKADWKARLVWLPNSIKYITPASWQHVTGWIPYVQLLPECSLRDEAVGTIWRYLQTRSQEARKVFADALGMPYLERCLAGLDTPSGAPPDTLSDTPSDAYGGPPGSPHPIQDQDQDQELKPLSNSADAEPDLAELRLLPEEPGPSSFGPHDLMALWNERAHPALPRVRSLTTKRRRQAASRLREHPDPEWWIEVIAAVNASPHCRGESRPAAGASNAWRCSLDFLLDNDTNAVKALEGVYGDDRRKSAPLPAERSPGTERYF